MAKQKAFHDMDEDEHLDRVNWHVARSESNGNLGEANRHMDAAEKKNAGARRIIINDNGKFAFRG